MADIGYLRSFLTGLDGVARKAMDSAFQYALSTFRIGAGPKATNFDWTLFQATTPAVANTEFSVAHGQGTTPTKLIPYLDLSSIGNAVAPLTVSRLPDTSRVYLKSSSTSVAVNFLLEW